MNGKNPGKIMSAKVLHTSSVVHIMQKVLIPPPIFCITSWLSNRFGCKVYFNTIVLICYCFYSTTGTCIMACSHKLILKICQLMIWWCFLWKVVCLVFLKVSAPWFKLLIRIIILFLGFILVNKKKIKSQSFEGINVYNKKIWRIKNW